MPSWNDPSNSNPNHANILQDLAAKDTYAVTMGQETAGYTDLPEGAMSYDSTVRLFRRLTSGTPEIVQISLAGGGTGAGTAAQARANFNVLEAGTGAAQARTNSQNDNVYVSNTRQVNTSSPLAGGGVLSSNLTLSIQDGTTSQKGAVQLNNTLTSTSTTQALTAAQGKAMSDNLAAVNSSLITSINNLEGKHVYNTAWVGSATVVTDAMIKAYSGGSTIGAGKFYLVTSSGRHYTVDKILVADTSTHTGTSKLSGSRLYVAEWGGSSKAFEIECYLLSTDSYDTSETIVTIYKQAL